MIKSQSHIISKSFDDSAFTIASDRTVTFRTGDVYGLGAEQRLVWKGREEVTSRSVTSSLNHRMHMVINCLFR